MQLVQFIIQTKKCTIYIYIYCRSQCPRGLRRRSAAARQLRSWVRIPPGAWIFVCCDCCVLSGRGVCDELITRPEEFYRMWCVVVCDLETSRMRRLWTAFCPNGTKKKCIYIYIYIYIYIDNILYIVSTPKCSSAVDFRKSVHHQTIQII